MRCYGPNFRKDTPFPPNNLNKIGFHKLVESASTDMGVIDQDTDKPFIDPDPIGINLAAAQTFAIFMRYSVNSYQVINANVRIVLMMINLYFSFLIRMARQLV